MSATGDDGGISALNFLAALRRVERARPDRPRIGRSRRVREEVVNLGQDPFLAFPDVDLSRVDDSRTVPTVRPRFLGFFGPFGALPLNQTEEVERWFANGDHSFVAFTDILVTRFQQLFYRTWSDARRITQFDHPEDRFARWLLSLVGLGTKGMQGRDTVDDTVKLALVPLAAGRVRSPVRLQQMLRLHFGLRIDVEEMVPSWMEFEPDSLSVLGRQAGTLGRDTHLGRRVVTVNEKIRVHVHVGDLARYRRFIPGGVDHGHLRDLLGWYLGRGVAVEAHVHLPADEMPAASLGGGSAMGWLARLPPRAAPVKGEMVVGTRYLIEATPPPQRGDVPRAA